MATSRKFDEEEAKNELLALTRQLFMREPKEQNADYQAGWNDLYSIYRDIIEASGFGLPSDYWRQSVELLTRDKN